MYYIYYMKKNIIFGFIMTFVLVTAIGISASDAHAQTAGFETWRVQYQRGFQGQAGNTGFAAWRNQYQTGFDGYGTGFSAWRDQYQQGFAGQANTGFAAWRNQYQQGFRGGL